MEQPQLSFMILMASCIESSGQIEGIKQCLQSIKTQETTPEYVWISYHVDHEKDPSLEKQADEMWRDFTKYSKLDVKTFKQSKCLSRFEHFQILASHVQLLLQTKKEQHRYDLRVGDDEVFWILLTEDDAIWHPARISFLSHEILYDTKQQQPKENRPMIYSSPHVEGKLNLEQEKDEKENDSVVENEKKESFKVSRYEDSSKFGYWNYIFTPNCYLEFFSLSSSIPFWHSHAQHVMSSFIHHKKQYENVLAPKTWRSNWLYLRLNHTEREQSPPFKKVDESSMKIAQMIQTNQKEDPVILVTLDTKFSLICSIQAETVSHLRTMTERILLHHWYDEQYIRSEEMEKELQALSVILSNNRQKKQQKLIRLLSNQEWLETILTRLKDGTAKREYANYYEKMKLEEKERKRKEEKLAAHRKHKKSKHDHEHDDDHHKKKNIFKNCATCRAQEDEDFKLMLCQGCLLIAYCDEECQRKHWSRHKLLCKKPS